ncbi:MAG: mannonate dehydratase [Chitinophagaceae bacterium]|nr:MAG: mannonate dehydratase [Chitinophagaceae bacterium]
MEKTWRWFGKKDTIELVVLRQIGVEGIVTALHHIQNGEIWPLEDILDLKNEIEKAGLRWSVVESLPVSEAIKYGGAERDLLIGNYIAGLENLGKSGVKTVCYNFMPVIDWVRTDLDYQLEDGSYSLYFDRSKFIYFDLYILERKDACKEYSEEDLRNALQMHSSITEAERQKLIEAIIIKTQGFVNGNITEKDLDPIAKFRQLLELYANVDKVVLRNNMKYFLQQVMPVCEKYGINMCVHPDDPPFPILGLPRIVTKQEDIKWILNAVDHPCNGLTFCAGSLSALPQNNVAELAQEFAQRTSFVHLRSTEVKSNGDFVEASHLEGRGSVIEVVRIFEKEKPNLPMRVDHGRLLRDDVGKKYNPGYSFLGRMLALGQMHGVIATVQNELAKKRNSGHKL